MHESRNRSRTLELRTGSLDGSVSMVRHLDEIALDGVDVVLCDLDGCLVAGDHVFDGVDALFRRAGERLHIVSNNSADTAETLCERLAALGVDILPDRVWLAGEQTIRHVARTLPRASVSIYGALPLRALAAQLGLRFGAPRPDIVVLARDEEFNIKRLAQILAELDGGARLIVTNADASHPGIDGRPIPETGALLAAVRACLPDLDYTVFGKPAAALARLALERAGVEASRALFVGDNPETDGAVAAALGMPFAHVVRGVSRGASASFATTQMAEARS